MAELGVAYISVVPDTSKLAPAIKGAATTAGTEAGTESGKTFGSRFTGAIGGALKTAGKAGLIGAGVTAGATILGGVKSAVNQEKAEATLAGLYGSAKTASRLMKDLKKVSSTSTIDYSAYTKTAQSLAYMGINGKDVPGILEHLGDAIAGAGGGGEELDRASQALLKMVNSGKVQLDTLQQMSEAGAPIISGLAQLKFGDTTAESMDKINKMASEGKISLEDVTEVMSKGMGKAWKMQEASAKKGEKTLSGQFSILKDNVSTSLGTMFQPGIKAAAGFVGKVNTVLFEGGGGGGFLSKLKSVAGQVGDALQPLWGAARNVFAAIGAAAADIFPALVNIGKALAPFAKLLATIAVGAIVVWWNALAVAIRAVGKVLGWVGDFAKNHTTTFRVLAGTVLGGVAAWKAYRIATATTAAVQKAFAAQTITTRIGLAALKVQTVAVAVAQKAAAAGARVFAAAQWLINAAMNANPILRIVTLLALLGTGLVVAYKKSATFRKIVNAAWSGVRKVAGAVVGWFTKTALPAMKKVFTSIGNAAKWLWSKAIKPAWGAIRKATGLLWKGVKLYFAAWKAYFTKVLFPVVRFLWNNVVKPVFASVKKGIGLAWRGIKTYLVAWKTFFDRVLFPAIRWLWSKVVKPVFSNIGKAIGGAWNNVIKPAFGGIRTGFRKVGDVIKSVWSGLKKPLNAFKEIIETILGAIKKVIDLKDKIPSPSDIGGGLKGVVGKFFATGGPVFGPGTATSDSVPAMLSNGEHVWTAAEVRAAGGHRAVARMRAAVLGGGVPKLAAGGPVASVGALRMGTSSANLAEQLRSLVRVLRGQVVPALLKNARPATPSTPRVRRTRPTRGGRNLSLLGGTDTERRNPRLLDGFSKSMRRKVLPTLEGFSKSQKKAKRETIGMELAVGKSTKKLGRYWTRFRQGPLKAFSKDWTRRVNKGATSDANVLSKSTGRTTKRLGSTLQSFRKGPLSGFSTSWGSTFRKKTPADLDAFRSRTAKTMGRTRDNIRNTWSNGIRPVMQTFGSYPRKTVAPMFAKGVDAIGAAWARTEPKTAKPVRYMVNTVLNKALIPAFNKIAKFVDTDTIKKITLPKGFATGGYTGPGHRLKPAGIVHAGEYVINKKSTARLQRERPGLLDNLNRRGNDRRMRPPRDRNKWRLPGYWIGGGVLPLPSATSISKHGTPYYGAWYAADLNGPYDGTPRARILAWKDGRVAYTKQANSSYGYETVINHPDGNFTRYAHQLPGSQRVSGGQQIRKGQHIGAVGETGNAFGAHLHFEIKGGKESQILGLGDAGGTGLPGWAQTIIDAPKKWASKLLDGGKSLASPFGQLVQGTLDKLAGPSADWAEEQLGTMAYNGPMSGSVTRFTPFVKKALTMLGESAGKTLVGAVLARMNQESGGNVGIVNKWDSNWVAGHPSVGLMQVIGPTYQAYKPHPDKGPYKYGTSIDPFSNIFAGLNYAKSRYGSIYKAMTKSGGYDSGGIASGAGFLPKATVKPERVLEPRQTAAFERMVARNFTPSTSDSRSAQRVVGTLDISPNGKATIQGWAVQEIGSHQSYDRSVQRMGRR